MFDAEAVKKLQKKYARIARQDFQIIRKSAFMAKRGRKARKPEPDLRSPEEIAEWEQICLASNEMQRRAKAPPPPKWWLLVVRAPLLQQRNQAHKGSCYMSYQN